MKNVYFIGIGGIGMSALARYFKFKGYAVSGYDKTPSDLTAQLAAEGIGVHYDDRPDLVPADVAETLVIWTPAIHELKELDFVRENGYRVVKRSLALGEVAKGQRCLAVSGTHGKTTTSTMVAHIFTESGEGCSAFLGGISRNYGTNLLVSDNDVVVAEADEFDRSFHQLFPEIAVITAIDADHLDIYGDYAHVLEAFRIFASQVSGTVIAKKGVPITAADTKANLLTYHYTDPEADFHAVNPHPDACGNFIYDLRWPGGVLQGIRVGAPGRVNAENSIAAAAVALTYGLDPEAVKHAIGTFEGVKRGREARHRHLRGRQAPPGGPCEQARRRLRGRLRPPSGGTRGGHRLPPGHLPGPEAHRHLPAAPVHPDPGLRARVRRRPERGGQAHPPPHLPGPGRADPRRHFRHHLPGRDRP